MEFRPCPGPFRCFWGILGWKLVWAPVGVDSGESLPVEPGCFLGEVGIYPSICRICLCPCVSPRETWAGDEPPRHLRLHVVAACVLGPGMGFACCAGSPPGQTIASEQISQKEAVFGTFASFETPEGLEEGWWPHPNQK
jgi:hypothetical protein